MKTMVAAIVLAAWAVPAVSQAQSLAEIAEKTKKKKTGSAKVITEDDLRKSGGKVNFAGEEGAAPQEQAEAKDEKKTGTPEKSPEEVRAEQRAQLQKKMDEQKKLKEVVQKAMDDAQAQLNDVRDYTLGPRRASLMKILEDGQKELAKIDQAMSDVEDEARRAGISVSR